MKNLFLTFVLSLLISNLKAQGLQQIFNDTNANFYDVVKEFDKRYKTKPKEKDGVYSIFKRWQAFAEPRVSPSGDLKYASRGYAYEEFQKFQLQSHAESRSAAAVSSTLANWTPIGPFGTTSGSNTTWGGDTIGGAGRIQVIRNHPTQANTIFVGTSTGGMWVSNNNGVTYTTTTDQISSLGVSDIAIDPINPNTIYISTGDKDAIWGIYGVAHSTGVLKSTNGGATWNQTGLVFQITQFRFIHRLLINPLNPNSLIAATSAGIYKTLDGGASWTLTKSGNFTGAEYRPGDTTVVYTIDATNFYKSVDGGLTFSSALIPVSGGSCRMALAVTPANNNYVYVLTGNNNYGYGGLFQSVNAGTTFSLMSTSPNIFDWSTTGSGTSGQAYYDICIGVSPTDVNEVIVGGVNLWKSNNGGVTYSVIAGGYFGSGIAPLVHADHHSILYTSANTCYFGNDGGVYMSTNGGTTFSKISANMNISQVYRIAHSSTQPGRIIAGEQDCGSTISAGTVWNNIDGGDGMDNFVDWSNDSILVWGSQYGDFWSSNDNGITYSSLNNATVVSGTGAWTSPIMQDPIVASRYYCGLKDVFRSNDRGTNWTKISSFNKLIQRVKVPALNNNYVFASTYANLYRTSNGGTTWATLTSSATLGAAITDFAFDNQNLNNLYVTLSGYVSNKKVFMSHDGGATWVNYSQGLPNIPINCIVYEKNSPQKVYVGTDVGVWYREGSMSSWMFYSDGLPNVIVMDLEIYYPTGKLRAGTFGRSVWETDLYSDNSSVPVAAFYSQNTTACANTPFALNDVSANSPSAWNWTFQGGSPATSTLQNPQVTYPAAGIYTITLVSTNSVGASAPYVSTITVNAIQTPTIYSDSGFLTTSVSANSYQWYFNGAIIPGATSASVTPNQTGYYTVIAKLNVGCKDSSSAFYFDINDVENITSHTFDFFNTTIKPNPVNEQLNLSFHLEAAGTVRIRILNMSGALIYDSQVKCNTVQNNLSIPMKNISSGIYFLNVSDGKNTSVFKFAKE